MKFLIGLKNQFQKNKNMKSKINSGVLLSLILTLFSCSNSKNATKEDICGYYEESGSTGYGTKTHSLTNLKCDGTFESGASEGIEGGENHGYNSSDRAHFTGTWEVISNIPEEVKTAVVKFGINDDNYSIIKYSSSNGISGYAIYHEISGKYLISGLYMGQVSLNKMANTTGALGIIDGIKTE